MLALDESRAVQINKPAKHTLVPVSIQQLPFQRQI
jgi:hypothetical protein